jgi:pimeloyl-ACP methyl ester carboxylesterase
MRRMVNSRVAALCGVALPAIAAVIATAAAIAVARAQRRRHALRRRQRRGLHDVWTLAGDHRIYSRVSMLGGERDALPIVLVHGWGVSSSYFVPMAERLAAEFAVYAPDLPGHGRSDTPTSALGVDQLATALLDWMTAMGIERAAVIGHSMGSQVSVAAALQQPERCERLVLMAPTPDPHARSTWAHVCRFVSAGVHERLWLITHMMEDFMRMGWRLVTEFRSLRDDPIEHKLPKLSVPVMLVCGEKDPLVPQQWAKAAARLARAERVAVIHGWGHAMQFSAPDETVDAVLPFLRAEPVRSVS